MSVFRTETVNCPSCATPVDFELVLSVNADRRPDPVSYTHLRAHETDSYLVCRLLRAGLPLAALGHGPDTDVLAVAEVHVGELRVDAELGAAARAGPALERAGDDLVAQVRAAVGVDAQHQLEIHRRGAGGAMDGLRAKAVSYTHLTLPTILLV